MTKTAIGRRDFLRTGAGLASMAAAVPAVRAYSPGGAASAEAPAYGCSFYAFVDHPDSDTCWSVSVGPDGRIYAAACSESVPGGTVRLMRYNESADALDYLFDLGDKVNDPGDSGRATQCKIHSSFAPSLSDGILYTVATHLSGPPIDQPVYSPWYSWHDPKRCFRHGAALVAFADSKCSPALLFPSVWDRQAWRAPDRCAWR